MARLGMVPRILGLIVLLIGLLIGGLFWFDVLGLINAGNILNPLTSLFGYQNQVADAENPVLLDELRVRKQEEALELRFQDLNNKSDELTKLDQTVSQRVAEVEEQEKALADRENSFNQIQKQVEDRNRNLEQNSIWLTSQRPEVAVETLKNYNDQDLIDILRKTEELALQAGRTSLVSVWLAKLDPARSAEIQRKMTIKPTVE